MSLKDISYLVLWWPYCLAEQNHLCNFGTGHQVNIFGIWTSGSGGDVLKYFHLELWQLLCSVDQSHLYNFGTGH